MIDRRAFIAGAIALSTPPLAAETQQAGKVYRVVLVFTTAPVSQMIGPDPAHPLVRAFLDQLRALGYVQGRNLVFEPRSAEGKLERLPDLVADLIRLKVDVIVSSLSPAIRAAKQQTSTIPIVMAGINDPVGAGFVASLARPGGNVTGLSMLVTELSGKRLELLKETLPNLSRAAFLWNPTQPGQALALKDTQAAARVLGVTLQLYEVRDPNEFDGALAAMTKARAGALLVMTDPLTFSQRGQLTALAAKHRLPAMYALREFVDAGGLMAYGPSFPDSYRRAATYVDKILKGAKPADLPVEQPTKFELVINIKTAKALGLTIPQSMFIRADEVIQ